MVTYKEKILNLVLAKNKLIKKLTQSDYINMEDINEIRFIWSESDCKRVWEAMSNEKIITIMDSTTCPWCHYNDFMECDTCGYGERHGICGTINTNRYNSLVKILAQVQRNDTEELETLLA